MGGYLFYREGTYLIQTERTCFLTIFDTMIASTLDSLRIVQKDKGRRLKAIKEGNKIWNVTEV